ncbi:MAG: hypothetical protein ABSG80_12435 [Verrucomicrobiota bacterium]|jgi:hypothetical protein
MSFDAPLHMTAVKLMNALGGDGAIFFARQCGGNFLPCPAPLALFVDEIHERFQPAVKCASAAGSFPFHWLRVMDDV